VILPDNVITSTMTANPMAAAVAPDWPGGYWWHFVFFAVALIVFILMMVMGAIWIERRGMGRMQSRLGPNRWGPFGLLQPVADAIKILLKENIVPLTADKIVHFMAPIVCFAPAMVIFSVIPFADGASLADLNIGILFIVAVSSISSVGTFMAGWGSGNKFSLLGAMRAVASVVSYEIPLVLGMISVVLMAGTLSMNGIVQSQNIPYILMQPLGFLIFFTAALAEINRSPFDLFEADQEIIAGYQTEYSGMRFAMFYLVEYAEAIAMSAIISTLFLGGWRGPFLPPWLWIIAKTLIVFFVFVWVRTTLPRVRIDQLMAFAWKFLLPLGFINLFITAAEVLIWKTSLSPVIIPINIAVAAVLILIGSRFFKLGRGRVEV
jgi:NADH-quinone oxidoreductase subunit H